MGHMVWELTIFRFSKNLTKKSYGDPTLNLRALGGWSFAMKDYYNEGITETLDDPINVEAQKTMDPFSYRERLTMPKLLIQVKM